MPRAPPEEGIHDASWYNALPPFNEKEQQFHSYLLVHAHSDSMSLISPRKKGNKDLACSGLMTTHLINTKIHSNTP